MQEPKKPTNEQERLERLRLYEVLDTLPERHFDDITLLASAICQVPIALISLVDNERQWFKSRVGLEAAETPRNISFCGHAILEDRVFEVPNALSDQRFADNPLVTGAPDIRFYAGAPLKTPTGHNIGTLCVIDRTARQLSEQQRGALEALARQVVSQLELRRNLVLLREAEVSLREASQKALASAESKARLLANVSHEIRTPLSGIIGMCELLQETSLTPRQAEISGDISQSSQLILRIVNDILDFSKIEARRLELELRDFDLKKICDNVVSTLKPLAEKQKVQLSLDFPSSLPSYVNGDSLRITQVLLNLVNNAIKFSPGGKVVLSIRSMDSQSIRFVVQDDGKGIPGDMIGRLFQSYAQADVSIARKFGGTGLGLSICKELVELMGGSLGVTSEVGRGSQFWFILPLALAQKPQSHPTASENSVMFAGKVLLAEDNTINQKLIRHQFEQLGFQVTVVQDGQDAFQAWRDGSFDLVCLDCQMPILDGPGAAQAIRRYEQLVKRPPTPIIALTGHVAPDEIQRCLEAGIDEHLPKPLNKELLRDLLERLRMAKAS